MPNFDPTQLPYVDPNSNRRVAVVTGASSGIGYFITLHLYQHGYYVYLVCRNEKRALDAIKKIKNEPQSTNHPVGKMRVLRIDLEDLEMVIEVAKQIETQEKYGIDVLINNAEIMLVPVRESKYGYEIQYQINFYAPFLFLLKLLPSLAKREGSRAVYVSSAAHFISGYNFNVESNYDFFPLTLFGFLRYGVSKCSFMQALNVLINKFPRITFTNVHPGITGNTLNSYWSDKWISGILLRMINFISFMADGVTLNQGSFVVLFCALAPGVITGQYYSDYKHPMISTKSPAAEDVNKAKSVWDKTIAEFKDKNLLNKYDIDFLNKQHFKKPYIIEK